MVSFVRREGRYEEEVEILRRIDVLFVVSFGDLFVIYLILDLGSLGEAANYPLLSLASDSNLSASFLISTDKTFRKFSRTRLSWYLYSIFSSCLLKSFRNTLPTLTPLFPLFCCCSVPGCCLKGNFPLKGGVCKLGAFN